MTVYVDKKRLNKMLKDIKAGLYPNARIVKNGYDIYDNDGYLVTEVRAEKKSKKK